jgi:hypothetical protein
MRHRMISMTRGGSSVGRSRKSCVASLPLVRPINRPGARRATQASVHVLASVSLLLRYEP